VSLTYNRGEWAELYVLAKILCEQSVTVRVHGGIGAGNSLDVQRVGRGSEVETEEFLFDGDQRHSGDRHGDDQRHAGGPPKDHHHGGNHHEDEGTNS